MIARVVLVLAFVASAGEARAQTRLFITNHVHSDQIGDLTVWQGSLVAGTLGGLLVVAPGSDEPAKILASPGGLPSNRVLSVARSPANALWAGTANRGLGRLTPEGTWRRTLTTFDGLPSDRVQALFVTGDSVWVGTSGGVALFTENPASGQVALRRSDNEASTGGALVSDDVLAFARTGDTLWVGTSAGLSTFVNGAWSDRSALLDVAVRSLAVHRDTLWAATAAGTAPLRGRRLHARRGGPRGREPRAPRPPGGARSGTSGQEVLRLRRDRMDAERNGSGGISREHARDGRATEALWGGVGPRARALRRIRERVGGRSFEGSRHERRRGRGRRRATVSGSRPGTSCRFGRPARGRSSTTTAASGSECPSASTGGQLQNTSCVRAPTPTPASKLWLGHCCRSDEPDAAHGAMGSLAGRLGVCSARTKPLRDRSPEGGLVVTDGSRGARTNGVYLFDSKRAARSSTRSRRPNTQGAFGPGLASNNLRGIAFDDLRRGWFAHAFQGLDIGTGRGLSPTTTTHGCTAEPASPASRPRPWSTTSGSQGWVGTPSGLARIRVNGAIDVDATAAVNDESPLAPDPGAPDRSGGEPLGRDDRRALPRGRRDPPRLRPGPRTRGSRGTTSAPTRGTPRAACSGSDHGGVFRDLPRERTREGVR
jgi:hypothetical protein